ncbi:5'-nucleotidase C-terminal domain-containing protein [Gymnodinialimonas sp. 2305UL16-5]|uniref:5'-nucleotidase C-terminal domain-containing protein n=1 Tax=Gymnodinialimonas mytili TaxID=3126503 RepID=UPI0030B26152
MSRPATLALSRRLVLSGLAALPAAAALPRRVRAEAHGGAEVLALSMADLHSPYARLPQVLAEIDRIGAETGLPMIFIINGDTFERGNVAALRSGGSVDLAFWDALVRRGPTILNLGNHETALVDDMATAVAQAEGLGLHVVGNLIDNRRGRFFAPYATSITAGGHRIGALGLAATNPFVYREPVRQTLQFLDPAAFAAETFGAVVEGNDMSLMLSHAGVADDKAILPTLPEGVAMIGAHDHLSFVDESMPVPYVHGGSWAGALTVIGLAPGAHPTVEMRPIGVEMDADGALAEMIAATLAEHLTPEETAVIGTTNVARDLPASILFAAEAVRAAAGADIAMLGHTTFGQPLPQGEVTRYDFDAYIRFDGDIQMVELSGADLTAIMGRANQHLATSLDQRSGDFVHAAQIDIDPEASYRLAVNGWTAINQGAYLGREDLEFSAVEGLHLKQVVADALAG